MIPITQSAGTSRGKYAYAGALHGEPVEVVAGPETGLLIPAHAELVLEGEMPSPAEESAQEGPFGEWPGYYSHSGPECVVRIKRVSFRDESGHLWLPTAPPPAFVDDGSDPPGRPACGINSRRRA